jgi:hypothetical protein
LSPCQQRNDDECYRVRTRHDGQQQKRWHRQPTPKKNTPMTTRFLESAITSNPFMFSSVDKINLIEAPIKVSSILSEYTKNKAVVIGRLRSMFGADGGSNSVPIHIGGFH